MKEGMLRLATFRRWRLVIWIALALFFLTFPFFASTFFVVQIGIQTLFLGIVALSIIFLAGSGGIVSMAQVALYGAAGYIYSVLVVSYNLPWGVGVLAGITGTTLLALIFALISLRTQGIYFLMITLAMAMVVYFYANQDRVFLGGHTGINGARPPVVGPLVFGDPTTFYYLALVVAALIYCGMRYLIRTPFGLAFQGTRDNTQRMQALGYNVALYRLAAFTLAGFIASVGGILGVWYNGSISPGTIDLSRTTNVLVIAVLGGLSYFEGAFVGAAFFTLITNFASSFTDRFNTVIGLAFLLVALFFPDGLIGLSRKTILLMTRMIRGRGTQTAMSAPTLAHPHSAHPGTGAGHEAILTASAQAEEKGKES